MTRALAAGEVAALQRAYALVQQGDGAAAQALLAPLPQQHPDVLTVAAFAALALGDGGGARVLFESALRVAPGHAGIWNSYANLLGDLGDAAGAVAAYQRAVAIDPQSAATWTNLGLAAIELRDWSVADAALNRALALAPGDAAALGALGLLEQGRGRPDAAATAYAAALAANPGDAAARHNLATALRTLGRQSEALAVLEPATASDSVTLRGHILADLGRFEPALAAYRSVIAAAPWHLRAHEALAELLPQIGRGAETLGAYHAALGSDSPRQLWLSAIAAAKAAGDGEQMRRWAAAAAARHGAHPDWALADVGGLSLLGDRNAALPAARAAAAAYPGVAACQNYLAFLLLQGGDAAAAEPHALRATQLAPLEQSPWSLLTLIWRLTGDARETWLADYERLVMVTEIAPPPGWNNIGGFLADVAETLTRLHITREAPAEQSLRGGTQTRGTLFESIDPVLKGLEESLDASIAALLADLPHDTAHPFLGRNTGRANIIGSWSVRLSSQGFHIDHIHPSGWLSSAFYVGVPGDISGDAGKLRLGVPDAALGLDLGPRRLVTPVPGRLVLFPSYMWHGTVPFDSTEPRLTVAFDALPD